MGRHSSGESNYRVARSTVVLVIAVLVVIAVVASWLVLDKLTEERRAGSAGCTKGDLSLRVTADPAIADQARQLVTEFGNTDPVVHDYCVRPQLAVSGSYQVVETIRAANEGAEDAVAALPAVWIPAVDAAVDSAKEFDAVSVSDVTARLSPEPVGLAVPKDQRDNYRSQTWAELAALKIAAPGGDDAVVSALVDAHTLGDSSEDLRGAAVARAEQTGNLTADTIAGKIAFEEQGFQALAATQSMTTNVGPGVGFVSPEGSASIAAPVVSFGSGGPVDENTARAAEAFTDFAAQRHPVTGDATSPTGAVTEKAMSVVPDLVQLTTDPYTKGQGVGEPRDNAAAGSTVLLLDTSTEVDVDAVRSDLIPIIEEAGDGPGRRVALWNFSSPQAPGVVSPVRANTYLAGGGTQAAVDQLTLLQSVGEPWLWPSLREAFNHARDGWLPDTTNRVVLVSSGLDLSGEDPKAAVDRLRELIGPEHPVRIDIVLVGEDRTQGGLQAVAETTGGSVIDGRQDRAGALRKAFGLT